MLCHSTVPVRCLWLFSLAVSLGCGLVTALGGQEAEVTASPLPVAVTQPMATLSPTASPIAAEPTEVNSLPDGPAPGLLQPGDLHYLGAFRLPEGPPEIGWAYSGSALAYSPYGDPQGADDGFPGSLFGTGHDWNQYVSEISIPVPVLSPNKNPQDLTTATTLQDFHNIRGDLFRHLDFEIPRVGLAVLPPQGAQTTPKLYFCWHQHMGEGDVYPTHGWAELDLAHPQAAGPWRIGDYWNYVTCDYLLEIPADWAAANTPGMRLATGRYRDGGQGALGPSLLAIGPWLSGNPPAPGARLEAIPLLLYDSVYMEQPHAMVGYRHSDEWTGAAWLTAGEKAAVVFAGTKGMGQTWYGCRDGTVWPDEPPFPPECPERGWWSERFNAQMLFYDPAQLAAVARGELESWAPQPYAVLDLQPFLFQVVEAQQKSQVGAMDFDRERGLLYLFELFADGEQPIIHVFQVGR